VTEINITTDRKEQVRLFIIMAASFTYNLIKLVDHIIEEIPKIIINLDSDSDTDSDGQQVS
jgi:hypothetical protein